MMQPHRRAIGGINHWAERWLPYHYSCDWVSRHAGHWRTLVADIAGKADVSILEIGSFEGRSAVWWLRNVATHPTSTLTCIDPWRWKPWAEANFDHNVSLSGQGHRVRKIKAESRKVLGGLPEASFDMAYIDGSHRARDIVLDGLMVLPLVKIGGLLVFDDYDVDDYTIASLDRVVQAEGGAEMPRDHLPKAAIEGLVGMCDDVFEVVHRGYQLVARRVAFRVPRPLALRNTCG